MGSKAVTGTEEGLEKAAKPRLGDVCGCGDVGVAVVGEGVKEIGEGRGDGMWVTGGVAGFGEEWGASGWGSSVVWEEESSSKPTTIGRVLGYP